MCAARKTGRADIDGQLEGILPRRFGTELHPREYSEQDLFVLEAYLSNSGNFIRHKTFSIGLDVNHLLTKIKGRLGISLRKPDLAGYPGNMVYKERWL